MKKQLKFEIRILIYTVCIGSLVLGIIAYLWINNDNPERNRNLADEINFGFISEVTSVRKVPDSDKMSLAELKIKRSKVKDFNQSNLGIAYMLIINDSLGEMIVNDLWYVKKGDEIRYNHERQKIIITRNGKLIKESTPSTTTFWSKPDYDRARRMSKIKTIK